jgi:hypothetical protein
MFHILLKIEMYIKVIRHSLEDESKKKETNQKTSGSFLIAHFKRCSFLLRLNEQQQC